MKNVLRLGLSFGISLVLLVLLLRGIDLGKLGAALQEADWRLIPLAIVQALEAILERHAHGQPASVVEVNTPQGGLVLRPVGQTEPEVLYTSSV